jgi:Protein of unknown function (DUF2917)
MIFELNEARTWSAQVAGAGMEVRVLAGTVWVTQEKDPEDHIVQASGVFVTDRPGRVAIQSLTPARLEVAEARHVHGPLATA